MIVHEHIGVQPDRVTLNHFPHQVQEVPPVPVIEKDALPVVSPGRNVIPAVLEIEAQRGVPWLQNAIRLFCVKPRVVCGDVTPFAAAAARPKSLAVRSKRTR